MIRTSNEFNRYLSDNNRKFVVKATITLKNGIVLDLDNDDIMYNGMKFTDSTSESGVFTLGSAIINSCTLTLNNYDGKFNTYDFSGAVIRPFLGLQLSQTIEYIDKGIYTVDESTVSDYTIVLNALDDMNKFDTAFSNVTVVFPCTLLILLQAVCSYCGVSLATTSFLNDNYTIATRPIDDAVTCREVVSWIAQISCNYARINRSKALELKWYDMSVFDKEINIDGGKFDTTTLASYQTGNIVDGGDFTFSETTNYDGGTFKDMNKFNHIYNIISSDIFTDDVTITGVSVKDTSDEPTTVLSGESGYVLSIEDNYLIQDSTQANTVSYSVGNVINGMTFRPYTVTAISDPRIEAGDITKLSDFHDNIYNTIVTNIVYTVGSTETITCDAESISANNSTKYSTYAKAVSQATSNTIYQISNYDKALQQLTSVVANGLGLFYTKTDDGFGGTIYYLHDKSTMDMSTIRWFMTSGGMLEQKKVSGAWTTISGTDNEGNALYNVLTARKVNADIVEVTNTVYVGTKLSLTADGVINAVDGNFTGNINSSTFTGGDINGAKIKTIYTTPSGTHVTNELYEDFLSITEKDAGDEFVVSKCLIRSDFIKFNTPIYTCMYGKDGISLKKGLTTYFSADVDGNVYCTTVNGYTPITTGNYNSYCSPVNHTHTSSNITAVFTSTPESESPINIGGTSNNIASVGWCNSKFETITSSDLRLKKNIKSLDDLPIELFMGIKPKQYEFKINDYGHGINFGVIAQEIESLFAEYGLNPYDYNLIELADVRKLTDEGLYVNDKVHRVNYKNFIAWCITATQKMYKQNIEQQNEIDELRTKLDEQQSRVDRLEQRLLALN